MLRINVPDEGIGCSIEISGLFPVVMRDLALAQRKIYDALPEEAKKDMFKIYTDPEYWKMVFTEEDDGTTETVNTLKATKGRIMRWIMEP